MARPRIWSKADLQQLRRLYPCMPTRQVAQRLGRSFTSVKSAAKNHRLTKHYRRGPWKPADEARLRALYPDTATSELARLFDRPAFHIYQKAARLGLVKSDAYLASPAACRLRRGDNVGAAYRFKKGQVPPNKGLRRPGWFSGRMRETQFRKGHQANPAKARLPIGHERVNADGYLERKITEEGHGAQRWRAVHVLNWEAVNGPLPPGHALVFRDRNRMNTAVQNLELVTRAALMRRNSYHRYGKDIALAIQARGQLTRQINKRLNGAGA